MTSPLVLSMALCAELTYFRGVDKVFILSPMRPVTSQTVQIQVLVPGVYHLLTDWMSRMFLPVMAGPAEIDYRSLLEKEAVVR
jgi:hypothetical protein